MCNNIISDTYKREKEEENYPHACSHNGSAKKPNLIHKKEPILSEGVCRCRCSKSECGHREGIFVAKRLEREEPTIE